MSPETEPVAALADPHRVPPSDSAGVPWAGRHFQGTSHAGDDGTVPLPLAEALESFARGEAREEHVVDAIRGVRLLVPLVATLGETGVAPSGLTVDKSAELALVTVAGPDGRRVLPVFGSVDTMRAWNPDARPIPVEAVRAALAAAAEGTELMVLDPVSPSEFVIRRPAMWAIAQSQSWLPSYRDPEVITAFDESIVREPAIVAVTLSAGDPHARLHGPELVARLELAPGLGRADLAALLADVEAGWAETPLIAQRVDSLAITVVSVDESRPARAP